ncbi:MAG: hypothetical protein KDD42_08285, partial [Bdellovibrionales bacterium]|nr:hypothetical protein [Bdellovibrionales bacterium]
MVRQKSQSAQVKQLSAFVERLDFEEILAEAQSRSGDATGALEDIQAVVAERFGAEPYKTLIPSLRRKEREKLVDQFLVNLINRFEGSDWDSDDRSASGGQERV